MTTTLQILSEEDFNLIKERLLENEIRFYEFIHTDSSFPGIRQSKIYGQILIEEPFNDEILNDFKDRINIDVKQSEPIYSVRKVRQSKTFLIAYSLLVTFGFVFYWYRDYRNASEKNFTLEWDRDNTELKYKDNNTWEGVRIYTDANYDFNFEKAVTNSKNGKYFTQFFDLNEDGNYESTVIKTSDFKTIARFYDDEDIGFDNRMEFILENKDTLILSDENGNGFYEIQN